MAQINDGLLTDLDAIPLNKNMVSLFPDNTGCKPAQHYLLGKNANGLLLGNPICKLSLFCSNKRNAPKNRGQRL